MKNWLKREEQRMQIRSVLPLTRGGPHSNQTRVVSPWRFPILVGLGGWSDVAIGKPRSVK